VSALKRTEDLSKRQINARWGTFGLTPAHFPIVLLPGSTFPAVGMPLPTFDEAKVALISGFRSPKQHGNFPWRGVLWRFISAAIYMTLIVVSLHQFARRESMTPWDRRGFNALTILLSGLVSLSLGSFLGLLGSVLRWRLLARATTTPRDADLILGMHTPAGAFKLTCHHLGSKGKWSRTTVIVLVYLIVNIAGRLSVAAFGLTYDFNENVGIEYPAKVTDFGSPNWVYGNASFRNMRRYAALEMSMRMRADSGYDGRTNERVRTAWILACAHYRLRF
jgi:hypothetical protein